MNKTNVMRILESAKIDYQAFEYDSSKGVDALSVAQFLNRPAEQIFKTLVCQSSPRDYHVFVVPANADLDLKKAAKAAGVKKVDMIPLKALLPTTGYIHGGCSPIGMKKQFQTVIDETAILFDEFCVSGGKVGVTIAVNPEKLASLINATFADITA